MIRKYSVLVTITVSLLFLIVATLVYPGGSINDKDSVGFDWTKNFISNLFASTAINGSANPARAWACIAMIFHSISYAVFFIHMSKKIPAKSSANIVKYLGLANSVFTFLIATPLHDLMIIISSTLFLINLFFITVFILKTRLTLLKFSCIICLLIFYYTLYLYDTGNWGLLAIMQKISFLGSALLILGLEYFSTPGDFEHIKPVVQREKTTSH